MPQIKLGFDRVPVPTTTRLEELKNFPTGETLRDRTGNILYTEVDTPLKERAKVKNATPVYVNNDEDYVLKIEEQFPVTSEVSSTLLGIDRAETQLSLFSDVSSYGLNEEEFEYFDGGGNNIPESWYGRSDAQYGRHEKIQLVEETNEQALVVSAFPTQFTYPEGPEFDFVGDPYNPEQYQKFLNFVQLGNQYYDLFVGAGMQEFADRHFLPTAYINAPTGNLSVNFGSAYSFTTIFNQVDNYTKAWMDIRDGNFIDPRFTNRKLEFLPGFDAGNTLPGKGGNNGVNAVLQTRKAYRYQPGRISGFTFGFKCSFDPASSQNSIEWGVANDTDMYMFQVRGSKLSIVRRSTIPLPINILIENNFIAKDQTFGINPTPFVDNEIFELVIPQDRFNKDTMDGNGPSGYNLDVTKVTMYKVEFGWYGAIGARFLAYVPTGNGDCRWVVLHTIVIENGMGQPCLNDPYFKFKYILNIEDTSNLREPQFLYKYGASCYIDGGDDNAGAVYSYKSNTKLAKVNNISDQNSDGSIDILDQKLQGPIGASVLGIQPKAKILNSDGVGIKNKRDTYIEDIKVISEALTKIDILEVNGCPGFGHSYTPSLYSGQTGITYNTLTFSGTLDKLLLTDGENFDNVQDDAHLIGDGIYGYYLQKDPLSINNDEAYLTRKSAIIEGSVVPFTPIEEDLLTSNGVVSFADYFNEHNIRFSGYNAIAASDSPLTGHTTKVNFINPWKYTYDQGVHHSDFFVGLSFDKPVQTLTGDIAFIDRNTNTERPFNINKIKYIEALASFIFRNETALATGEAHPAENSSNVLLGMDFRIPKVQGEDNGYCSQIVIKEEPKAKIQVKFSTTVPNNNDIAPGNYLLFAEPPTLLITAIGGIIGAQIGLLNDTSGLPEAVDIYFTSEIIETTYTDPVLGTVTEYAVEVSAVPDTSSNEFDIYLSPIKLTDHALTVAFIVADFYFKPYYIIFGLRDNAEINNISIEETTDSGKRSFVPDWITNQNCFVRFPGGCSNALPSANFVSSERLSGNSIDTQTQQPMRPGKIITTIYTNPNNLDLIDLTNIYGADRQIIAPGDINSKATFILATNLDNTVNNFVSLSIVTREI